MIRSSRKQGSDRTVPYRKTFRQNCVWGNFDLLSAPSDNRQIDRARPHKFDTVLQMIAHCFASHDEREQTMNQLMVEIDNFDSSKGVIIMAATNRLRGLTRSRNPNFVVLVRKPPGYATAGRG